jgi:hypothetical protein
MVWVGDKTKPRPVYILTDFLDKRYNLQDEITMAIDVPVFEGYYNKYTDVDVKQSGKDVPTVIIGKDESRYPANVSDGVDLGVDVKIQILGIRSP